MEKQSENKWSELQLEKSQTGIKGLDEVLNGGLPQGRPTLICGSAGSGKTLMASEFLVRGAIEYDEPGVFMAFEETQEELAENLASLGIDLNQLVEDGKIFVDHVRVDRNEIEETGEYDLEGLFIRLASAIAAVNAKRVVLDTIEAIFTGFSDTAILRSELRRLFRWLKDKRVTAVVTGERGEGSLTRHGLEEYVSDCVILLDHRVRESLATRKLRVVKYRGSSHGNDEYPFLIDERGIWVLPVTSVGLDYPVSREFISTGIPRLDTMLDGNGYYRGSSVLVSGTAGTGKTSLAAHLAVSTCKRGERCLYFAYEESGDQIIRNMASIGIDMKEWVQKGQLRIEATRPSFFGAEMHLLSSQKLVEEFAPNVVVMDPISSLAQVTSLLEVKSLMVRMIDFLKMQHITAMFTSLTLGGQPEESSEVGISSLMDTWIMLTDVANDGERNRVLAILKSRGMEHSNQMREFRLTDSGIDLLDVYVGQGGVLTGSARLIREKAEKAEQIERQHQVDRQRRELERRRKALQAQIEALQAQFESEVEEMEMAITQIEHREQTMESNQKEMAEVRKADLPGAERS
ncbi:MAG: circadian clock protein KaiC [Chloroflexi bacterium]|nr:MAG: circadian clock protein KaiC [Chloroflexota bacterium]